MKKKKKNIKEYKVSMNSQVLAVSLVEHPATESNFIMFSEDEDMELMAFSSDEKRNICGAVLIPDQPIYRNNGEMEYYITFSKESIEKLSMDFLKGLRQNNVTLQHNGNIEGATLCEMWIKSDMYKDKSVAMGLSEDLPVGTLFATYHIDSMELYDKIKSGEVNGFSVEAIVGLDEMEFNKQEETSMDDMNFWNKMSDLLMSTLGMRDNSKKEEQTEVEMAEETPQEAPQATETAEVVEEPIQEEKTPTEEANEVVETEVVEEAPKPNEDLTKLQDLVENLKAELEALKAQNTTLEGRVKEMGKQPSAKPLNTAKGSSTKGTTYAEWREAMSKMF